MYEIEPSRLDRCVMDLHHPGSVREYAITSEHVVRVHGPGYAAQS